ncbi:MAG: prephenate/arogenate dehydrogenase family protein [Hyphomonadaceae bacterium]
MTTSPEPFKRVAIIGAGHIGSSIARATQEYFPDAAVVLYDANDAVRARAGEIGLGEIAPSAKAAAVGADLVVLAVPVGAMAAAAMEIGPALGPEAVLTDTGSVKSAVVASVAKHTPAHAYFVPAHPVAGTEFSGPESGFATLFQNRWLILTPLDDVRSGYARAVERLGAMWRAFGAQVEHMRPDRHDLVLAVTSHLPHLIAYNIVSMAEELENVSESEVVKYSAGSFRDFTRIAASDPTMWRDIFLSNREAVLEVLGRFSEELATLQRAVRNADGKFLFDTFTRARRMRREVIEAGQESPAPNFGRDKS